MGVENEECLQDITMLWKNDGDTFL
jgi:hypothetical protein